MKKAPLTALVSALLASMGAGGVTVNGDGLGQALVYPYYTVRSAENNAFNTYLSVVNHTGQAKAVRVRIREGRAGRETASFNLYLSPNDVWTGALVPTSTGTRLITADRSCTDPEFAAGTGVASLELTRDAFSGDNSDGYGDTLDRTREGYVEVIEMATLTGASAGAVQHNASGVPANCAAIRSAAPSVAVPTGGLSGTLTLINVSSGQDFTVNAEALADLSTRAFYRAATDPYPSFAANEIDPVSVVAANGQLYRSAWSRGLDAVAAALMRSAWFGEYVLDSATASLTDFVLTQPLRHHYASATTFQAPYTSPAVYGCLPPSGSVVGETVATTYFNREEQSRVVLGCGFLCPPFGESPRICAAAAVGAIRNSAAHLPLDSTRSPVLGSYTPQLYMTGNLDTSEFQNGWISSVIGGTRTGSPAGTLASLPSSTRMNVATGTVTSGAHVYSGLPILGFAVRTYRNGTLACSSGACQGNYGGAFPLKYRRSIGH